MKELFHTGEGAFKFQGIMGLLEIIVTTLRMSTLADPVKAWDTGGAIPRDILLVAAPKQGALRRSWDRT
jgi:hypothetical protein